MNKAKLELMLGISKAKIYPRTELFYPLRSEKLNVKNRNSFLILEL